VVNPELKMPAFTQYIGGGGPIIPGKLFPFLFVTIACGAISGFHALVASGTTPKLLNRESDARIIGFGGMLMEGLVGVVALIAACSLNPGDYFAINLTPEKFAQLGIPAVNLETLSREVGEVVAGRPGGAVSLAVGFAQIFTGLPGLERLMSFWYHFAIMFEALFILTTIDAGTRVMRFMVQEFGGRIWKPMERTDWLPANVLATTIVVCSWGYFLRTGSISTIWPMFGTANQLLAAVALAVSTSVIINARKERYAWITIVPMVFVAATTLTAGILNITDNFWPLTQSPSTRIQGYVNSTMTLVMIYCAIMVMVEALKRWYGAIVHGRYEVKHDESHIHPGGDPPFLGCC
jgi:carbon starvation protein